jgi:hypothetical protein
VVDLACSLRISGGSVSEAQLLPHPIWQVVKDFGENINLPKAHTQKND